MPAENTSETTTYRLRSVDRVCDILDVLANSRSGASLVEVGDAAALPKSSAFRYLAVLESRHYVERSADGSSYRLGPAFRPQHGLALARLIEIARPVLERLRDALGETTNLGMLDGTAVVHTLVCESKQMMRLAARVGDHGYVHATALGKVMCAQLPQERTRSIVMAAGMPPFTDATITDLDRLFEEFVNVRASGYALDDAENQVDGRCIAVSLDGLAFPAGISMSAPTSRFPAEQAPTVAKALRRAAREILKEALA